MENVNKENFSFAIKVDKDEETVVLPTPPLPPTKIHRSVSLLTMCSRVGSMGSNSTSSPSSTTFAGSFLSSELIASFLFFKGF